MQKNKQKKKTKNKTNLKTNSSNNENSEYIRNAIIERTVNAIL